MKSLMFCVTMLLGISAHAEIFLGKTPIYAVNYNYATGNVSSGSWKELVSSLPSQISYIQIQDNSGQIMQLATGASGSESAIPFYVTRGGNDGLFFSINNSQRISIRATSSTATASTGEIIINFFQ